MIYWDLKNHLYYNAIYLLYSTLIIFLIIFLIINYITI